MSSSTNESELASCALTYAVFKVHGYTVSGFVPTARPVTSGRPYRAIHLWGLPVPGQSAYMYARLSFRPRPLWLWTILIISPKRRFVKNFFQAFSACLTASLGLASPDAEGESSPMKDCPEVEHTRPVKVCVWPLCGLYRRPPGAASLHLVRLTIVLYHTFGCLSRGKLKFFRLNRYRNSPSWRYADDSIPFGTFCSFRWL